MKKFTWLYLAIVAAFAFGIMLIPTDENFKMESLLEIFKGDAKNVFVNNCNGFAKKVTNIFDNDMNAVANAETLKRTIDSYPYLYDGVLVIYSSYGAYEFSVEEDFGSLIMYVAVDRNSKTTYMYAINTGDPGSAKYMLLNHVYNSDKKIQHGVVSTNSLLPFDSKQYEQKMGDAAKVCADIKVTTGRSYICVDRKGELIL